MGDIIGAALVLLAAVVLIAGGIAVVAHLLRPQPHSVESPHFRNHQAMARWIEHTLRDEKVAGSIAATDRDKAKELLAVFYGERPLRGRP